MQATSEKHETTCFKNDSSDLLPNQIHNVIIVLLALCYSVNVTLRYKG